MGTTGIILIMKIVINRCFGGYQLSHEAVLQYCKLKNIQLWLEQESNYWNYWTVPVENRVPQKSPEEFYTLPLAERIAHNEAYVAQTFCERDILRNDPALVQVVEALGEAAAGDYSNLQVVEIPDDVLWHIEEYDGMEQVAENHRVWS